MKTDKTVKNRKGRITAFVTAAMAAVLLMVIFMSAEVLDILMTVNVFLSLAVFLAVVFTGNRYRKKGYKDKILSKETAVLSVLPVVLLLCAIFGFAVCITSTRLILATGAEVDSKIIVSVSGIVSAGGTAGIIAGFAGLVILCVVMVFAIRGSTRIAEIAARSALDVMPAAMAAIERAYTCGEINEELCIARKDHIGKQNDFLDAMKEAGKFVAGNAKVTIFIMAAGVLGGIITGTALYGQTIREAAEVSIAFGISGGVIFLLPLLLLSITAGIVSSRVAAGFSVGQSTNTNEVEKI